MYTLEQLKRSFTNMVMLGFNPELGNQIDQAESMNDFTAENKEALKNFFESKDYNGDELLFLGELLDGNDFQYEKRLDKVLTILDLDKSKLTTNGQDLNEIMSKIDSFIGEVNGVKSETKLVLNGLTDTAMGDKVEEQTDLAAKAEAEAMAAADEVLSAEEVTLNTERVKNIDKQNARLVDKSEVAGLSPVLVEQSQPKVINNTITDANPEDFEEFFANREKIDTGEKIIENYIGVNDLGSNSMEQIIDTKSFNELNDLYTRLSNNMENKEEFTNILSSVGYKGKFLNRKGVLEKLETVINNQKLIQSATPEQQIAIVCDFDNNASISTEKTFIVPEKSLVDTFKTNKEGFDIYLQDLGYTGGSEQLINEAKDNVYIAREKLRTVIYNKYKTEDMPKTLQEFDRSKNFEFTGVDRVHTIEQTGKTTEYYQKPGETIRIEGPEVVIDTYDEGIAELTQGLEKFVKSYDYRTRYDEKIKPLIYSSPDNLDARWDMVIDIASADPEFSAYINQEYSDREKEAIISKILLHAKESIDGARVFTDGVDSALEMQKSKARNESETSRIEMYGKAFGIPEENMLGYMEEFYDKLRDLEEQGNLSTYDKYVRGLESSSTLLNSGKESKSLGGQLEKIDAVVQLLGSTDGEVSILIDDEGDKEKLLKSFRENGLLQSEDSNIENTQFELVQGGPEVGGDVFFRAIEVVKEESKTPTVDTLKTEEQTTRVVEVPVLEGEIVVKETGGGKENDRNENDKGGREPSTNARTEGTGRTGAETGRVSDIKGSSVNGDSGSFKGEE